MNQNGIVDQQSEHYRRGQILGFTMAEIMLVLLFLLLLLLGTKITKLSNALESKKNELEKKNEVFDTVNDKLDDLKNLKLVSQDSDPLWLTEKLVLQAEDIIKKQNTWDQPTEELIEQLTNENSKLTKKNKDLNSKISSLESQLNEAQTNKNNNDSLNEILKRRNISQAQAQKCLLDCGGGPKACWGESLANPDFIYNVALRDDGIFVSPAADSIQKNILKWKNLPILARIESPILLNTNQFRQHFSALLQHGKDNDCVYQVRMVDFNTSNKPIYKSRRKLVEGYVYPTQFKHWDYGKIIPKK